MTPEHATTVDTAAMKNLLNPAKVFAMDEDLLLAEVNLDGSCAVSPFRFGGMIFYYCLEGTLRLVLDNDRNVILGKSHATASHPGCIVKLNPPDAEDDAVCTDFLLVAISQKYIFDLKIDMGELFDHLKQENIKFYISDPTLSLSDEVIGLLKSHLRLIGEISASGIQQKKYHYTLLISSMQNVLSVAFNHCDDIVKVRPDQVSRSKTVFADFMKMAVENFETERSIRFYADRLCLTPKYLSKLIKEGCGSSASTIIDNLVIAKAKNLLKHTDFSVKLIAAKLNFSSQSSFNKFFKAKTGTSPLKFRSL